MAATRSASLIAPRKVTASRRPISSTKRCEGPGVGGHDRPAHDLERRRRVVVRPGDEQRHEGELDALVGGDPADADPAGARVRGRPRCRGRVAAAAAVGAMAAGGTTAVRGVAGAAQLGLVERDTARPRRCGGPAPRSSLTGPELVAGHRVVPGGVVLGRRHVVVVDGERLASGPASHGGDGRRGGELVEEDVARARPRRRSVGNGSVSAAVSGSTIST